MRVKIEGEFIQKPDGTIVAESFGDRADTAHLVACVNALESAGIAPQDVGAVVALVREFATLYNDMDYMLGPSMLDKVTRARAILPKLEPVSR